MSKYKLWVITFEYYANHIDGRTPIKLSYNIPGKSEGEALKNARNLFSQQEGGKELIEGGRYESREVTLSNYRERIKECRKTITLPKISLDAEKFTVTPKIADNGRTLEFIVDKK